MAFTLIKGRFCPKAGLPDGDSVRFVARNPAFWARLEGRPVKLGTTGRTKNTAQLRFEGIDAIEKRAIKPLSTLARDNMLALIGFDAETNPEPEGYILARMTDDKSGRPICIVFSGSTSQRDGTSVFLDGRRIRDSVNYQQARAGLAYPLYYNTLFASLRAELNQAVHHAKAKKRGYWRHDKTQKGVRVRDRDDLATIPPIWPKLWRRLEEFLRQESSLDKFIQFLEKRNERVDILPIMEERGLHDVVAVRGNRVRLTEAPENLRVVAKAGRRGR